MKRRDSLKCWATIFALVSVAAEGFAGFTTEVWPRDVEHAGGEIRIIYHGPPDGEPDISNIVAGIPSDIQGQVLDGGVIGNHKGNMQWRAVLVLLKDRTVRGWGWDETKSLEIPEGLSDVVQLTANHGVAAALKSNGEIVRWGFFTDMKPEGTFARIASGSRNLLALTEDGEVNAYGQNSSGELDVPKIGKANWIDVWGSTLMATDTDGKLYAWGKLDQPYYPLPTDLPPAKVFARKNGMGMIITTEGKVFTWGDEKQAKLGKKWNGMSAKFASSGEYSLAWQTTDGSWANSHPTSTLGSKLEGARTARTRNPFTLAVFPTETIPEPKPVVAAKEPMTEPKKAEPEPTSSIQPPDIGAVKKVIEVYVGKLSSEAGKPYLDSVSKLDSQYGAVIAKLEESATAEGNLDLVQAAIAEKKLLAGDGIPKSSEVGTPEQILQLRKKYQSQIATFEIDRNTAANGVITEFDEALKKVEVDLTKNSEIESALEVRKFRENLGEWLESELGFQQ
ncbi:MAG: hypothetical protein AAF585_22290 [Verrucomicrobiota bacterium]